MDSKSPNDKALAWMHDQLSGRDYDRAMGKFHRRNMDEYRQVSYTLVKLFGISPQHIDDVAQEIAIVAAEIAAVDPDSRSYHWGPALWFNSRSRIRALLESGQWDGVAGLTTRRRRLVQLKHTRSMLQAELKREPTRSEIVDRHNTDALRRYKDPVRQGMVATEDDLAPISSVSLTGYQGGDPDDENEIDLPEPHDAIDESYRAMEMSDIIASVIDECRVDSPTTLMVAEAWFASVDESGKPTATVSVLADELGLSYEAARQILLQVKELAVTVLSERFGIDSLY